MYFAQNDWKRWYNALEKPLWTPSGDVISFIWMLLYPIIFLTYGYVLYKKKNDKKWKRISLTPFVVNLTANLAFTPILFGLKNIPLATIDIIIVWITIVWTIKGSWSYSKTISILQIPYLLWVSTAGIIQISIFLSN